ncbi:Na+/H+ antiporter NhaA [Legionella oakridgensis]|uniref:Na(+)/H(+) antiporter NhaA n=2 Tax=Legionella oakridgensis TaxID=29423 RepID=W0BG31_9GAMM|nr:Na+/H+ antiporter NhaA [Legionella oakridgensis]AHE67389.1 Na+/H+ antiporter NhaA [Legionella oakridgensis ATCC 33761 = DSM 21215]ETO92928.1 sodium/proton antiporter, NhaA family [Legionella oakridgensis RV-2-2007]KTD43457.1 pH-dependent sodium/proton antiporter [Legionella oakridgensis]STY20448.1 sodium-proton antiporter [Legionella longbeachae]
MNKPKSFYNLETIGGLLLFAAALLAIIIANTPLREAYDKLFHLPINLNIGDFEIKKPLHIWINDGLMAIYFMLVGLEIKREIKRGILSSKTSILVPAITALCGLLVPAIIYSLINSGNSFYLRGWAIPTATDIAFTLGILSLLNTKVPFSLKILLTAIAIFDDIGAIVIIAIFFTHKLSWLSLALAGFFTSALIALNYFDCKRLSIYLVIGVLLWAAVLKSGVHATLAGIVIAMTIPDKSSHSLLAQLENGIHPWVVFLILPLFAFANAGVSFIGIDSSMLTNTIVLGIAAGLFFGKQIGIFLPLWFFIKQDHYIKSYKSYQITLTQIYGIALICGVGFTMSLFIGSLAFQNGSNLMNMVKIGVVTGSLISATLGSLVFLLSHRASPPITR